MHFMLHHHDVEKGKQAPITRVDVRLSSREDRSTRPGDRSCRRRVTVFTSVAW